MSAVALLLSPMWLSWKNGLLRGGGSWLRRIFLAALAGLFWLGTYWVIRRVLRYFDTVFDLGPGLAYQLLTDHSADFFIHAALQQSDRLAFDLFPFPRS